MALKDLTRDAVLAAIREHDALSRGAFLDRYGFQPSRSYVIEFNGKQYDSKAIAGVAHGYLPGERCLNASEFSGGRRTVAAVLEGLGFAISVSGHEGGGVQQAQAKEAPNPSRQGQETKADWHGKPTRNQTWARDELILALDLYMRNPKSPPAKTSGEVAELSDTLNALKRTFGISGNEKYRNVNGVYMKLMNFRSLDPSFRSAGKTGLTRGGKDEQAVWDQFAGELGRLRDAADAIRRIVANVDLSGEPLTASDFEPSFVEAEEGAVLSRFHLSRERSQRLAREKKRLVKARTGALKCEACDFDFLEVYGERGEDIIDVHHTRPVHTLGLGDKTTLDDLALVCANCHRIIHAKRTWLSISAVRQLLAGRKQ